MLQDFQETLREVIQAIGPITLVIVILQIAVLKTPPYLFLQSLIGIGMAALGIAFFLLGVRIGLLPMGEAIGGELPNRGSVLFIVVSAFIFGFVAAVAEPGVHVLITLIDAAAPNNGTAGPLVLIIGFCVGFLVAMAMLRIVFGVPIEYLFAAGYGSIILLSFFTPPELLPIAFDAGGVSAGLLTIPVILALGVGFSSVLGGRSSLSESFGLIGLASMGPIIGVMLAGVLLQ
ncbi:MAG: DUF1538 domain-containing protein [Methanomicrobiaceae archaeon]|uniref:Permease of the major facilitator superfamily n=1 Tax=hydrocarbon metagenome TaxID=938273 RepID=A0A0W8FGK3_9ZZZZ|nr:DUF1538 domain-containing protein [Methanomicrobiaceae archaeon]MDD5419923.1 DUF1538 domain-containing protein [Methanomicrobiaceae archaeon]